MITNNMDFIKIFEQKLIEYTGFKYAICVDCCTNGILLSFEMFKRNGLIDKNKPLKITPYTYMSVPMTLQNNGWKIEFDVDLIYEPFGEWKGKYAISNRSDPYCVIDAATDLHENMIQEYDNEKWYNYIVCVSFQQKKRLPLGRGGVIFTNNQIWANQLYRLRYDGRNAYISDNDEIINNPNDIVCGYHCYMEPDKAARGILLLNQKNLLHPYIQHTWKEYQDLRRLKCWK